MKTDGYGEIINDIETYELIAHNLKLGFPMLIGWTDGAMSHFDILFNYQVAGEGMFQGGISKSDLFVSVMRKGSFGFEVEARETHPAYIGEKLNMDGGETLVSLAELINGVKACLAS